MEHTYLAHHGIKGQQWGVRRWQNEDGTLTDAGRKRYNVDEKYEGRIIDRKQKIYRISTDADDKTYDNKKYVSLNKKDHQEWQKYIGDSYAKINKRTYNIMYTPVKDLKIAKSDKLVEFFFKDFSNIKLKERTIKDTEHAKNFLRFESGTKNPSHLLSLNFAAQTETGKEYIKRLIQLGYDGVEDKHGTNVADDPVIIFNPDVNLKKKSTTVYK